MGEQDIIGGWFVDPMDADTVMSPENDADDVVCNAALSYRCWQWLSRLCGSGNTNPGSVYVDRTRPPRKAITFSLEWTEEMEAALCQRCRRHMQQHSHGELCGQCGAQFTINRVGSWQFLNLQHGVAHGTSSPVLEKCLTRSQST